MFDVHAELLDEYVFVECISTGNPKQVMHFGQDMKAGSGCFEFAIVWSIASVGLLFST